MARWSYQAVDEEPWHILGSARLGNEWYCVDRMELVESKQKIDALASMIDGNTLDEREGLSL